MGLRDRNQTTVAEPGEETSSRHSGYEYETYLNKKSINMNVLEGELNRRSAKGWKLHSALEQDGNLICIFERRV